MIVLRKLWKSIRNSFTPDVLHLHANFSKYFEVVRADTEMLQQVCFFIRHKVYCEELDWQPRSDAASETDSHDAHAIHLLIRARRTRQYIATMRIVRPNLALDDSTLPFEDVCQGRGRALTVDTMRLDRSRVGELSRLAVLKHFRRRSVESQQAEPWSMSEGSQGTQWFPYIPAGLYLGAMNMALEAGIDTLFFLALPRLARHIGNLGVDLQQIGDPVEHRGMRAPYMLYPEMVVEHLWPMFKPMYYGIAKSLKAQTVTATR